MNYKLCIAPCTFVLYDLDHDIKGLTVVLRVIVYGLLFQASQGLTLNPI